jgi:hypothetical protein
MHLLLMDKLRQKNKFFLLYIFKNHKIQPSTSDPCMPTAVACGAVFSMALSATPSVNYLLVFKSTAVA